MTITDFITTNWIPIVVIAGIVWYYFDWKKKQKEEPTEVISGVPSSKSLLSDLTKIKKELNTMEIRERKLRRIAKVKRGLYDALKKVEKIK